MKLAVDGSGEVGGMIQYIPIEHSFIEGKNLYFINCIWFTGIKREEGTPRKKALLHAAETDQEAEGAKGMVAWGIPLSFWMKASWFKKQGYTKADKQGILVEVLLWKPFTDYTIPPK